MSQEYNQYLDDHINNVRRAFDWLKTSGVFDQIGMSPRKVDVCDRHIVLHDKSKYNDFEYRAYDSYFYGEEFTDEASRDSINRDFNNAWLCHIHHNKHHWQHWVLINDNPEAGTIALDMPTVYLVEMVCDWWSFGWKCGRPKEIFAWYEANKDHMILSDSTRARVEEILNVMREKLG